MSYKSWCGTYNYTIEEEVDHFSSILHVENTKFTRGVAGKEVAPTTGQKHLQFYFTLSKSSRLPRVRKLFPTINAHFEGAKGTAQQNYTYCTKEGEVIIDFGEFKEDDKKGKIHDVMVNYARQGINWIDAVMQDSRLAGNGYKRSYEDLLTGFRGLGDDSAPRRVTWIYGDTGTGKSYMASQHFGAKPVAFDNGRLCGYDGSYGAVVFDDVRHSALRFDQLLLITDPWGTPEIPTKGGSIKWRAKTVVFTAPFPPEQFPTDATSIDQLMRRINCVIHLKHPDDAEEQWTVEKRVPETPLPSPLPLKRQKRTIVIDDTEDEEETSEEEELDE